MSKVTLASLETLVAEVNTILETPEHYEDAYKVAPYTGAFSGKKCYKITRFNGEVNIKSDMAAKDCETFLKGMRAMAFHSKV